MKNALKFSKKAGLLRRNGTCIIKNLYRSFSPLLFSTISSYFQFSGICFHPAFIQRIYKNQCCRYRSKSNHRYNAGHAEDAGCHFRVEGSVEAANQIVETVEDGKGAEKGCRAEGDSDHGNGGDEIDGTDSLAGKQIATRHKEGESTVSHKNPKVYPSVGAAGLFSEEPPSARSASMWSR